jgi:adenosylcobinamide kinase/adenosylcobinamide-phosphate guanylyltransferase
MIHLVVGGARSGKSRFAETLASNNKQAICYVATATAGDEEMSQRIAQHQLDRPSDWLLVEEPLFLANKLTELTEFKKGKETSNNKVILIECMTLWLSNWLCRQTAESDEQWQKEKLLFLEALRTIESEVIIVSNEVGSGIVPLGKLTRDFADQAGWLNQELAKIADRVWLVVAGCPISIKGHK